MNPLDEIVENLNTDEASLFLQKLGFPFKPKTLEIWRSLKRGPQYKKVGGKVFYTKAALLQFSKGKVFETRDSVKFNRLKANILSVK